MSQLPPGIDPRLTPLVKGPYPDYKPNLIGKGELEDITIAICTVVMAMQVVFLGIRFFTKIKADAKLAYDDWLALIAAILCCALCYLVISIRAMGRHMWDYSLAMQFDPVKAKFKFAALLLIGPTVFMGKICLLALYLKLFGHMDRVRWSIYVTAFFSLILPVMLPLGAAKCGPIKGMGWGKQNPACHDTFAFGVFQGTVSLVIDLFILVIPIPIIMKLNLARRKRYGVLVIFLTGIVAIIADIVILIYRVGIYRANDPTWAGFIVMICSIVETSISVVCSSMPTLAKFSRQHLSHWGFYISIRSYLSRQDSSGPSGRLSSLPKPKPRKRYDPYSINMPTEHSTAPLEGNTYMELGEHAYPAPIHHAGKDIKRTISVEQFSMVYSERPGEKLV